MIGAGAFSCSPVRPLWPHRAQVERLEEGQRAHLWREAEELLNKKKAEKHAPMYPSGEANKQLCPGQLSDGDLGHCMSFGGHPQHHGVPQDTMCLGQDHCQTLQSGHDAPWSHDHYGSASQIPMRLTHEIFGPAEGTTKRQSTCGNRAAMQKNSVASAAQQLKTDM